MVPSQLIMTQILPSVYQELPKMASSDLPTKSDLQENFLSSFLARTLPAGCKVVDITEGAQKSVEGFDLNKKKKFEKMKLTKKTLTSKEKKKLKIFEIKPEEQNFHNFIPMYQLWLQYMKDLIHFGNVNSSNLPSVQMKILKADYHGCLLTVCQSKCPSFVGTTGIVVMETKNTFKVITKNDKLKCIPKRNSIFCFQLGDYCYTLYGNHLQVRASERTHRRFKTKSTIAL